MKTIQFTSLKCITSSERRNDDLFFSFTIDGSGASMLLPENPSLKHTWDIAAGSTLSFQPVSSLQDGSTVEGTELTLNMNDSILVELMDYDAVGSSDSMGTATIRANGTSGAVTIANASEGDEYVLSYTIS